MVKLPLERCVEGWSIWQTNTSWEGGYITSFQGAWGEAQGLKKVLQALAGMSVRQKLKETLLEVGHMAKSLSCEAWGTGAHPGDLLAWQQVMVVVGPPSPSARREPGKGNNLMRSVYYVMENTSISLGSVSGPVMILRERIILFVFILV